MSMFFSPRLWLRASAAAYAAAATAVGECMFRRVLLYYTRAQLYKILRSLFLLPVCIMMSKLWKGSLFARLWRCRIPCIGEVTSHEFPRSCWRKYLSTAF